MNAYIIALVCILVSILVSILVRTWKVNFKSAGIISIQRKRLVTDSPRTALSDSHDDKATFHSPYPGEKIGYRQHPSAPRQ